MAKRVFFSFHYEDVVNFRANVVRNHWITKEREDAGFFDASIWESAKTKGVSAVKNLIDNALHGTSTTVVLIGSGTFERRWVRYEIIKSVAKGNHIVGVHINNIKNKDGQTSALGQNPLEHLAVRYNRDGSYLDFLENKSKEWTRYNDYDGYGINNEGCKHKNKSLKLSSFYMTYNWTTDDGYNNFSSWIDF